MRLKIYLFIGLLIALGTIFFASQNNQVVTVYFFRSVWETNVAFLILISVLVGLSISWLLSVPTMLGSFWEKMGLRSKVKKLEKKLGKTEDDFSVMEKKKKVLEKEIGDQENGIEKIEA